jgi:hypothetical protein
MAAGVAIAWFGGALGALPVLRAVRRGGSDRPVAVVGQATALARGRHGGGRAGRDPRQRAAADRVRDLARPRLRRALLVVETRWTTRWLEARAA